MEKLKETLQRLSDFIECNVTMAGNASFDIASVTQLRAYVEDLEKQVSELEKVQNYNKDAKNFKEPENRVIKGKAPVSQKKTPGNMVNHPSHYQSAKVNGNSLECIDVMQAVKGWYPTAIFCELNAFKYNWRLGNKDNIPQELGKIQWYSNKARELWKENTSWFYPKNQHFYAIIDEIRMKDPTTGEWLDGVLYTDGNGTYVRDKLDFINKFKKA